MLVGGEDEGPFAGVPPPSGVKPASMRVPVIMVLLLC